MQLKKFANSFGFTETEFKVLLFLGIVFFAGIIIKYFNLDKSVYKNFDYRQEDSLFWVSDSSNIQQQSEIKVRSENEEMKSKVLGFHQNEFSGFRKKEPLKEFSININSADKNSLMKLPGIGEKTAQKIIDYRNKMRKFNSVKDLMNVKGIQKARLEKIKKYIYVN